MLRDPVSHDGVHTVSYFFPFPLVCARSLPATLFTFLGVFWLPRSFPAFEASFLLVAIVMSPPVGHHARVCARDRIKTAALLNRSQKSIASPHGLTTGSARK